jgi:predicted O-methyltransferase YrrM
MSYHGYLDLIRSYIDAVPRDQNINVIEVGVDKGISFLPLAAHLVYTRDSFQLVGVDIKVRDEVSMVAQSFRQLKKDQRIVLAEQNSLVTLRDLATMDMTFDVFLLDGDHNYHTVSQELALLERLTHPNSMVVVDDYDGRWSTQDQWYCDVPGYESVQASPKVDTDKHGVKAAVDEFVVSHPAWSCVKVMPGEPIVLTRELKYERT